MPSFLSFVEGLSSTVVSFLMSEPVCWFVGVALLLFVINTFRRLINL